MRLSRYQEKRGRARRTNYKHTFDAFEFFFRPIFRSYKPTDEQLKDTALPDAEPNEVADHVREELDNEDEGVEIEQLVRHFTLVWHNFELNYYH